MQKILTDYLKDIAKTTAQNDGREETYYSALEHLLESIPLSKDRKTVVTTLPRTTEAGNPDFRVWDGDHFVVGYIEAKRPGTNLDQVETSEQLQRYLATFPNLILTDFYEFRLFRDGKLYHQARIARHFTAQKLKATPTLENPEVFQELIQLFFDFKLPVHFTAESLAIALAKRTRFLRDQVVAEELRQSETQRGELFGYYQAFQKYLIPSLTPQQFADLYAQTVTYGLFAARTRVDGDFKRSNAIKHIPHTTGILRDVFRYISLGDLSEQMQVIVDDIVSVLNAADINSILNQYYRQGKGEDPIIHFYETFLNQYDPETREKRGVYYTPEPVVRYIVRSVHEVLKQEFDMPDGLADGRVTLLDPAAGTLTFPAEAIKLAVQEYTQKYGEGAKEHFIRSHILQNFYAFELMMAPYAIGHMKIGYLLESLGFHMRDDDAFKLYLTNTLEMDEIMQSELPGVRSLSEESRLAGKVKREPILVILGNPPYSGHSANKNEWTEKLLKEDLDGAQSYYKVDDQPLGERNPKWLQDDYVKFLRFAQWKIQKAGQGIVAMITNHSWLDNPSFRGMRQSISKTFNKSYIYNLHGNSIKRETSPDGTTDENVFDIRVGTSIEILIKTGDDSSKNNMYYADLYGIRDSKYRYLEAHLHSDTEWDGIHPSSPLYLFISSNRRAAAIYNNFPSLVKVMNVYGVGIATHRDNLVVSMEERSLDNRLNLLLNRSISDEVIRETYSLRDTSDWSLSSARTKMNLIEKASFPIVEYAYRPFDERFLIYDEILVTRPRQELMRHMLEDNLALIVGRQGQAVGVNSGWNLAFVSRRISDINLFYRGGGTTFPLFLYSDKEKKDLFSELESLRSSNINESIFGRLQSALNIKLEPERIFAYIYAVLYSPSYRNTYLEFLKVEYPRIPFTGDSRVFNQMATLGERLKDLHLLQSPELEDSIVKYQGQGSDQTIQRPSYNPEEKRLYINKNYYFENLDQEVWEYQIGGYQVLDKYLKDRRGQTLKDPRHIIRVATALAKTIQIQTELDLLYPELEENLIDFS